jgi:hypothetical protein
MLGIAEPRAKSKAECFDRPCGTDLPFTSFPSTSYWATFTESLRNKSPHHTILALRLTRMAAAGRALPARSPGPPPHLDAHVQLPAGVDFGEFKWPT